ncbi:MAG: ABC transporter substrate-binding protein [Deltaproteobacteria bacterium]|jgi:ABC-type nitrate/sulfonate/bicarbonate transport system substrate-binding protein/uncharacterized protein (DUF3820 family)|nr:ABC transporter substrate-binding protein [Deltaproteobacteria bacterium]
MPLKKNHKIIITVVVLILFLIGFGAYKGRVVEDVPSATLASFNSQNEATHNGKPLHIIKTYTRKDCGLAPWLVTDRLGYFAEEGVKLIFTGEIQPPQVVPSILNGNNDVNDFHPNALAVAVNGGAKIKGVVRAGVEPSPELDPSFRHMWWFVNPEKYPNVKTFADLKNIPGTLKFSIISTTQCSDFLANLILDRYGIPRDKVEWVTMPDVQAVQALKQGHIDVGGVHPPFYKGMVDAGQYKIGDSSDANLPVGVAGLGYYFFTEDFIRNNHEAVKGFARAIIRGHRWINANPEQARLWTQESIGIPVSANHYLAENLQINEADIQPWLDDLEYQEAIPRGKLKPSDLVVHDFETYELADASPGY